MQALRVRNTFVEFDDGEEIPSRCANKFRTCPDFEADEVDDEPTPVLLGSPSQTTREGLPLLVVGSPHFGAGKWLTKNTFIHMQEGDATPHQRRHRTCPAASDEAAAADEEESDDNQPPSGSGDRQGARKVGFAPCVDAEDSGSDEPLQTRDRRLRHLFRTEDLQESLLEGSGYEPYLHPHAHRRAEESHPVVVPQVSSQGLRYAPKALKTSADTSQTTMSPSSGPSPTSPVHVDLTMFPSGASMDNACPRDGYGRPLSAPMHSHPMPHMFQGYPMLPPLHGYHDGSAPWPHYVMHPPTIPLAYPLQSYPMPPHGLPQRAACGFSPQAAGAPHGPAPAAAAPAMAGQEAAVGASHGAGKARGGRRLRLWAHIYLHMQVEGFDLVPRLIGRGGCNMRKIAEQTGAKIRIRGRGSGHLEIDSGRGQMQEAPTPLMIAVTTDKCDIAAFRSAIAMTLEELRVVEARYKLHIDKNGIAHEGPCYSIGLLPDGGKDILADVIAGVPFTPQPSRIR